MEEPLWAVWEDDEVGIAGAGEVVGGHYGSERMWFVVRWGVGFGEWCGAVIVWGRRVGAEAR